MPMNRRSNATWLAAALCAAVSACGSEAETARSGVGGATQGGGGTRVYGGAGGVTAGGAGAVTVGGAGGVTAGGAGGSSGSIGGFGGSTADAGGSTGGAGGSTVDAGAGGSGGAGGQTQTDAGEGGSTGADASNPAADARVDAQVPTDAKTLPAPPATWTEHWFEHVQVLKLVDYNDLVAVYFDDDVVRTGTDWITPFMTRLWAYTVETYGPFKSSTTDGRLYAVFHQGKYSGGHPSTYFDSSHDFRNVSDCGPGPWPSGSYILPTHETSHVVEIASNGVHGSPAFGLWGDSKWAEFYIYDAYVGLGMTAEAKKVYDDWIDGADTFPRAGTYWFRDWFYPLWRDHGHGQVMAKYFKLLSQHFPKSNNNYSRDLNWGEFVHFMSGAAGTNLKAQAVTAFGTTYPTDAEFAKAQTDFPQITY
jgi:hypothetical protein